MQYITKLQKKKVHIKSRIRFILFLVVCILISLTILFSFIYPGKAEQSDAKDQYISIYVESGDTLWGLSRKYSPDSMDIRKYIEEVKKYNQLSSSDIKVGQIIRFPKK